MYFIIFIVSFAFYEEKVDEENDIKQTNTDNQKILITSTIFFIILSNAIFYTVIKLGQNNSKLFMQYDFQKVLSVEMVTYLITVIVFISRIIRIIGNIIFDKLYLRIKDKMSMVLTILEFMAFALLIIGHFIGFNFILKIIVMSAGFFLILAIRDSFSIYIEDTALKITKQDEQQKIMINIETYRKLGQLLLSVVFTLILMKYELIVIEFILLILSAIEIIVNRKMCKKLEKIK